jgi:hypothetical protein
MIDSMAPPSQGGEVPPEMGQGQVLQEKEGHPAQDDGQRQPVASTGALAQKPGAEESHMDRRRILQQNGVGGGGQLVGQHEQGDGASVGHRPAEQVRRPGELQAAADQEEEGAADGTAHPRNRHRVPVDPLDEQSAQAPQECCRHQLEHSGPSLHA